MKRRDFVLGSMAGTGVLLSPAVLAQARPCPIPAFGVEGGTSTTAGCSQSGSALAAAVRAMTPGSWAAMSPVPSGLSAALGAGSSTGNMIPYCNAGTWNPVSKRIEILGQDHGWGNMRHVQYDEATNSFNFVGNIGTSEGHGYDHYNVNPTNGDLYYKEYAYGTGGRLWRKPYGGSWNPSFSTVPIHQQVGIGTCWWTGSMTPAIGNQGVFMLMDSDFGTFAAYDPVAGTWFTFGNANVTPGYHSVGAYSAVHNCAVFGGGTGGGRRIWRVNSDRTFTELANCPSNCQIGIYQGGLVCDPVSGKFLVLSGGNLFQLDPTGSGTWTQLTGARVPPAAVNNPTATESMLMCELPDHGAIAVVSMSTASGNMYLYRHT